MQQLLGSSREIHFMKWEVQREATLRRLPPSGAPQAFIVSLISPVIQFANNASAVPSLCVGYKFAP